MHVFREQCSISQSHGTTLLPSVFSLGGSTVHRQLRIRKRSPCTSSSAIQRMLKVSRGGGIFRRKSLGVC